MHTWRWFRPHDSIREMDLKLFKCPSGKSLSSGSAESELLTRLAFFSGAAKAHVEESLTQNLDRGKLDLKVFDEKHAADLKVNGHATGALEAVTGNAGARAEIEVANVKKRRAVFAHLELYSSKIYYGLTLTDQVFTQKVYDYWLPSSQPTS